MKLYNENEELLDFYHECTKSAGYLRKSYISRHLAIYELYKKAIELPGSVAELGIYNGATFFLFARLIEIFNSSEQGIHHSSSRHLFGFDSFKGFPEITNKDNSSSPFLHRKKSGLKGNRESFFYVLDKLKAESSVSDRLHVIEGNILETFDGFLGKYTGVRFCICLMDFDLYEPTKIVLDKLYDLMVPGGIIAFDNYGFLEFPGETIAADEFIRRHNLSLKSFSWAFAPSAYCIIPNC